MLPPKGVLEEDGGGGGGGGGQQAFCLVAKWRRRPRGDNGIPSCLVAKQAVEFPQVQASNLNY